MLLERGDREEARQIAESVPGNFQTEGLAARIRLEDKGEPDLQAAWEALDAGDREKAVDLLIEALPNADGSKDDIRQAVVAILDDLGVEHPVSRDARRRLAAALY
jgi:putative thioredoxin